MAATTPPDVASLDAHGTVANSPNIGAHVSLGSKPLDIYRRLAEQGFRSAQIFASSPSTWRVPAREESALQAQREGREAAGIGELFIHAVYLINLAAGDERIYESSIRSLIWTMRAGKAMGARGVIIHVGSHRGSGFEAVRPQIRDAVWRILHGAPN